MPSCEPLADIVSSAIQVVSLNLGQSRPLSLGTQAVETGISKYPSTEPVVATSDGLVGDFRCRKVESGHQALCVYSVENYAFWSQHFGSPLAPATFGENLTLRGATETDVHLGGIFRGREVVLEITYPRTPCKKLNVHLGRRFSGSFLESCRVGYYLRVLQPGVISPGEVLEYRATASMPTVAEFVHDAVLEYWDPTRLLQLAQAPSLTPAWRERILAKVERATTSRGWIGLRTLRVEEVKRDGLGGNVVLRCRRGFSLPEMARGDTLSFEHRETLLAATFPVVSEPASEGPLDSASRRPVDAYILRYPFLPASIESGSFIRARAPSSLQQL